MLLNRLSYFTNDSLHNLVSVVENDFCGKKVYKSHWIDKQSLPEQLVVGFESTSTTLWADSVEV